MTVNESHIEFKLRYDKFDSLNYPNYEPEEIDLILNQAQDRITKQRYGFTNIHKQSFEETQKRIEDLRELLRTIIYTPTSAAEDNISNNAWNVVLEDDHWFTIWESAIISVTGCNSQIKIPIRPFDNKIGAPSGGGGDSLNPYTTVSGVTVEVRPTTHVELTKNGKDSFKGPGKDKILRIMYRNRIELITREEYPLVRYIYRYIKKPARVDINTGVTFELSDHLHTEIIDEAVNIALEGSEAKRTGTFKQFIDNFKE